MFRLLDGISFVNGEMGSGKSLYATFRSLVFHGLGRQIFSNSKSLKVPHTHVDLDELLNEAEYPHWNTDTPKYFFLDEIKTIADGYAAPSSKDIRQLRILFTQFRKRHAIVDYLDQLETGGAYFLRRLTNYVVECEASRHFGEEEPYKIAYRWARINRTIMLSNNKHGGWIWNRQHLRAIYPYYDTFEIIEAPTL